jgi:hypothetical protein
MIARGKAAAVLLDGALVIGIVLLVLFLEHVSHSDVQDDAGKGIPLTLNE